MNKVILMGRLTRDPEIRYGGQDNQMAIARFSLAVDRRFKRAGDSADADFFNCTAFGKQAEFVERYLKQGTKILLSGRVQNDNYTNKEGQKVYSVQIIAEELEFAESKNAFCQQPEHGRRLCCTGWSSESRGSCRRWLYEHPRRRRRRRSPLQLRRRIKTGGNDHGL